MELESANKSYNANRVLIISQHFPPEKTANASRTIEMALNFNRLGNETIVFSPHPTFPNFKRVWKLYSYREVEGINVLNIWSWQPKNRDARFFSRILYYLIFPIHAIFWVLIYSRKFDVIITSNPPIFTGITGLFAKIFMKKKWVIDTRDLWVDASISLGFLKNGSFFEKITRLFEKFCYSRADLVLVVADELRNRLDELYEIKRILITPNGADTDFFCPNGVERKDQIIFVGNIGHAIDLENFILAMKYVRKKYDIKLLIYGDGDQKVKYEKLVENQDIKDQVIFKGLIDRKNVPSVISESLIGIAPIREKKFNEGAIPVKVFEYLSCETPFIAIGSGRITEFANKSKAGFVVENSPKSISSQIMLLLRDYPLRNQMGKNGRDYIINNYNRKTIFNQLKMHIDEQ